MELNVLESSDKRAVFELLGADHTVLLLLKNALEGNEDVVAATFAIDHPLVGHPKFIIETKKGAPKKVLLKAISDLDKEIESTEKELEKKLK